MYNRPLRFSGENRQLLIIWTRLLEGDKYTCLEFQFRIRGPGVPKRVLLNVRPKMDWL